MSWYIAIWVVATTIALTTMCFALEGLKHSLPRVFVACGVGLLMGMMSYDYVDLHSRSREALRVGACLDKCNGAGFEGLYTRYGACWCVLDAGGIVPAELMPDD